CALPVAVHARVLEEVAVRDHRLEPVRADEVVVLAIALARARRARGERNRQADVAVTRQAGVDDARLARPGRGGDDEQGAAHGCLAGGGRWWTGHGGPAAGRDRAATVPARGPAGSRILPLTRCSAPARGSGRSAPSVPPPRRWCGRRPTSSRGCWPRG